MPKLHGKELRVGSLVYDSTNGFYIDLNEEWCLIHIASDPARFCWIDPEETDKMIEVLQPLVQGYKHAQRYCKFPDVPKWTRALEYLRELKNRPPKPETVIVELHKGAGKTGTEL